VRHAHDRMKLAASHGLARPLRGRVLDAHHVQPAASAGRRN